MADSEIVIASENKGKLKEFQQLFSSYNKKIYPQSNFNVPFVEESGLSFVENAIIKARNAAKYSGRMAIADDSGLEVDALNGQPGIYSARFSADKDGLGANDAGNNLKLLSLLENVPENRRTARFVCALAFMRHEKDPTPLLCLGSWNGRILEQAQGHEGFGYDPLFFIPELSCTAAELPAEQKNRISHRGKAMAILSQALKQTGLIA